MNLIVNCSLVRIDRIQAADVSGDQGWSTGSDIAVDCTIDEPTRSQRWALGAVIKDATAVLYVLISDLPEGGGLINEGDRLRIVQDDESVLFYQVIRRGLRSYYELSHQELFLEEVPAS